MEELKEGNGLNFHGNLEVGIYPESPISDVKTGIILIGSKRIQEGPELFSLHFRSWDTEFLGSWERDGWGR